MDTQELQQLKNRFNIIGDDPVLNRALEMAVDIGKTDLSVLVWGESGVGKENIPKIIHQNSRRKNNKYLAVNCGAIPEGTIDAELFGHEKGSFTGAVAARKGYFEEADGGTLFLDEIGELPLASQAKLLRVLESGEFLKVGSSVVNKTNVRLIAATNRNLLHSVSNGKFRADLYYRLSTIQIKMPPLRERGNDIYRLFRKFSADFSDSYALCRVQLSLEAVALLGRYRWPGNIRQLKNVAESLTAFETSPITPANKTISISAETLAKYIPAEEGNPIPVLFHDSNSSITDDDKQNIYRAIYSLKAEVDKLKEMLASGVQRSVYEQERPAISAPAQGNETQSELKWTTRQRDDDSVDVQDNVSQDEEICEPQPQTIKGASSDLIKKALERHNGNRKKAAEELGISERTLYRKIKGE